MTKKENVSLRKTEDFEEVDRILSEAMASLDEANERVGNLLNSVPEEESDAAKAKATGQAPEGEELADEETEPQEEDGAAAESNGRQEEVRTEKD